MEVRIDAVETGDEDEMEMVPRDASLYRAITARVHFLAQDRSDLQYASKEASRRMSTPKVGDWNLLKRLGRHWAGRPRMVSTFAWQDWPSSLTVYADSNWAGCRDTRKSTSGACFIFGTSSYKVIQQDASQHRAVLSRGGVILLRNGCQRGHRDEEHVQGLRR